MSDYREQLDVLIHASGGVETPVEWIEKSVNKMLEAIDKADKYDKPRFESLTLYNEEHKRRMELQLKCKEWQEKAEKYDEEYKEHINYLEGKIKLLETSVEAFEQENEILKDGVKTLKEIFNYVLYESEDPIITDIRFEYDGLEGISISKQKFELIKAMLKVVENENRN